MLLLYFLQVALAKPTTDDFEYHLKKARESKEICIRELDNLILFKEVWKTSVRTKIEEAVKIIEKNVSGHVLQRNLRIDELFFTDDKL